MQTLFRTPYNYVACQRTYSASPFCDYSRQFDVVDTGIDASQKRASQTHDYQGQSYFSNADVPIKLYGDSVLASHFDPFRQRVVDAREVISSQQANSVDGSVSAAASAVAANSSNVVNSQENA